MEVVAAFEKLHSFGAPCVVALGTFDGLHRGHVDVIRTAGDEARRRGELLAVFTFSNHPYACFRPQSVPPALITAAAKHRLLEELGVDVLVDIPFDARVASLEPEVFLERLRALSYSTLVVGSNFTYGLRGAGTVATLAESARRFGFHLIVRELVTGGGTIISSTAIRALVAAGEVAEAARMLGRSYSLSGVVARGERRGRTLGFPTANLELGDARQAVPAEGVYAVRVYFDGASCAGMANIGTNPTFAGERRPRLEAHLFAFDGDLYGKEITVEFLERVRGEKKFASPEALRAQLARDRRECLALAARLSS